MLWYPPDDQGWINLAEQGWEVRVKEFTTVTSETKVVMMDVYDSEIKAIFIIDESIHQILHEEWEDHYNRGSKETILWAQWLRDENISEGQSSWDSVWKVEKFEGMHNLLYKDQKEILDLFTKLSSIPTEDGEHVVHNQD